MTEWTTHAARRTHNGAWRYDAFGTEQRLRIIEGGANITPVRLIEDPAGPYFGWLRTGADMPDMIRRRHSEFLIQFPYGYLGEERAGCGRMVRLRIEEAR